MTILKLVEVPGLQPGPGIPLLQVGFQKQTEPKGAVATAAEAASPVMGAIASGLMAAGVVYALYRLATKPAEQAEPAPEPEVNV